MDILFRKEVYDLVGVCMEVHNYLGHGLLEVVYRDALEIELSTSKIPFEREKKFAINYKGITLPHQFRADFFVMDRIILEIKATKEGISGEYIAQVLNYLKISRSRIGLIVNFGKSSIEFKRIIF
jgi:GxxExxY protein